MIDVVLWFALALMWSSSYAAIKLAVESLDPMQLVSGRMIIGALIMLAVLRFRGMSLSRDVRVWGVYALTGLLGSVIPFLLISYGEHHVSSALAALLMGIAPVATVLLAHLLLSGERLTPRSASGIAIGILGLVMLVGPDALYGLGKHLAGQFAIIAAALCYAVTTIYVKARVTRPALEMAAGSMLTGAISITAVTLASGANAELAVSSPESLAAVIYLGVFSTALATLIYFHLVPRLGANRMSQVNFAVPVGGALIGVVLLDEAIAPAKIMALGVITVAIYLVTTRPKDRRVQTA